MNEISILPFKHKYLHLLLEMLNDRDFMDIDEVNMKTLPKIGYIALMNKQPIAAGFLRRVEGGYAQIDTLVSNPYYGSLIRHQGIDGVVKALLDEARVLRLRGVLAFTKEESVVKRAELLDFKRINQSILGLKIL